jgi:YgiT-type zinc finger domain-containing protein
MSHKPCPSCSQGILSEKKRRFWFSYNEHKYWIPDVKIEVCDTCGEEVIEAKEIRRMEKIARGKFENQYTDKLFVKIEPLSVNNKRE